MAAAYIYSLRTSIWFSSDSINLLLHSFPPPFITGHDSGQWLLDVLAEDWLTWLPADTKETIEK